MNPPKFQVTLKKLLRWWLPVKRAPERFRILRDYFRHQAIEVRAKTGRPPHDEGALLDIVEACVSELAGASIDEPRFQQVGEGIAAHAVAMRLAAYSERAQKANAARWTTKAVDTFRKSQKSEKLHVRTVSGAGERRAGSKTARKDTKPGLPAAPIGQKLRVRTKFTTARV